MSPWRSASRCTAPTPGSSRSGPRRDAADCSPRRPSATRSASRTCTPSTRSSTRLAGSGPPDPSVAHAIVKLNEGVSGEGNALVDLAAPAGPGRRRASAPRSPSGSGGWRSRRRTCPYDAYMAKLEEHGGIVEELISGVELRSPSVQLRVAPTGEVELLSTHDQLLGGPSGQSYLGCRFPADFAYAKAISADARDDRRAAGQGRRHRPLRHRLRRGQGHRRRAGRRTPSSSTSGRAAPRTRS